MRFSKRKLHFFFVVLFYVGDRETEKAKKKGEKPKNPIKIGFF